MKGHVDWDGGGGEEVRDEVPPHDLAVSAPGLQQGRGQGRVLAPKIKYNRALVKRTWKGPRETGAEADRRRECYVS